MVALGYITFLLSVHRITMQTETFSLCELNSAPPPICGSQNGVGPQVFPFASSTEPPWKQGVPISCRIGIFASFCASHLWNDTEHGVMPGLFASASHLREPLQVTSSSFRPEKTSWQGYSRNAYCLWKIFGLLPSKGTYEKITAMAIVGMTLTNPCTHVVRHKTRSSSTQWWVDSSSSS